jgi:hypothetical protein
MKIKEKLLIFIFTIFMLSVLNIGSALDCKIDCTDDCDAVQVINIDGEEWCHEPLEKIDSKTHHEFDGFECMEYNADGEFMVSSVNDPHNYPDGVIDSDTLIGGINFKPAITTGLFGCVVNTKTGFDYFGQNNYNAWRAKKIMMDFQASMRENSPTISLGFGQKEGSKTEWVNKGVYDMVENEFNNHITRNCKNCDFESAVDGRGKGSIGIIIEGKENSDDTTMKARLFGYDYTGTDYTFEDSAKFDLINQHLYRIIIEENPRGWTSETPTYKVTLIDLTDNAVVKVLSKQVLTDETGIVNPNFVYMGIAKNEMLDGGSKIVVHEFRWQHLVNIEEPKEKQRYLEDEFMGGCNLNQDCDCYEKCVVTEGMGECLTWDAMLLPECTDGASTDCIGGYYCTEESMQCEINPGDPTCSFAAGPSANNNMLYIIIAVIAVAGIGGYMYYKKK